VRIAISTASRYCNNYTTASGDCDSVKEIAYFKQNLESAAARILPGIEMQIGLDVHFFKVNHRSQNGGRHISPRNNEKEGQIGESGESRDA
jgi:hypothetical protein